MSLRRFDGTQARCGLRWSPRGEVFTSGGDVDSGARGAPKWMKHNHPAVVKAVAFSPWSPLLAIGSGSLDTCILIWDMNTGARLHTYYTGTQVTGVHWSVDRKLLVSTHGFPGNVIAGWGRPALNTHRHRCCRIARGNTDAHAHAHTQTIRDLQRPRLTGSLLGALAQRRGPRDALWCIWDLRDVKEKKKTGEEEGGCGGDSGDSWDSVRSVFSVSFVGFSLCIP